MSLDKQFEQECQNKGYAVITRELNDGIQYIVHWGGCKANVNYYPQNGESLVPQGEESPLKMELQTIVSNLKIQNNTESVVPLDTSVSEDDDVLKQLKQIHPDLYESTIKLLRLAIQGSIVKLF